MISEFYLTSAVTPEGFPFHLEICQTSLLLKEIRLSIHLDFFSKLFRFNTTS